MSPCETPGTSQALLALGFKTENRVQRRGVVEGVGERRRASLPLALSAAAGPSPGGSCCEPSARGCGAEGGSQPCARGRVRYCPYASRSPAVPGQRGFILKTRGGVLDFPRAGLCAAGRGLPRPAARWAMEPSSPQAERSQDRVSPSPLPPEIGPR